ncbi:IS110 family transposase [Chondrinema litorale]|uniref:IS110 family transposase n=1 Tax=Chondrinema litorale TaxID=2994555 RepID=UPI0025427468|nr:transposase [Chondrinema litorale]UZR97729.1 transposase [Chondrinema litorale]
MKKKVSMEMVNPQAAGIDVGSRSHYVSIGQTKEDIREFGVYTQDHEAMIAWLKESKITTIAMESTGSYRRATSWQTLFSALQLVGFEVILVNGRDVKNVKGKKTDSPVQLCLDTKTTQSRPSQGQLLARRAYKGVANLSILPRKNP